MTARTCAYLLDFQVPQPGFLFPAHFHSESSLFHNAASIDLDMDVQGFASTWLRLPIPVADHAKFTWFIRKFDK